METGHSAHSGVHFKIASHNPEPVRLRQGSGPTSAEALLKGSWGQRSQQKGTFSELLQSSLSPVSPDHDSNLPLVPDTNGFVNAAITAYSQHHDLVIRPDDVWISILTQFNFYVNAHSEELRTSFVAHEGQKHLELVYPGCRYSLDYSQFARDMTGEIEKNIVDPTLKDWILPNFSTTTDTDTTVAAVVMMATLKAYFSYGCATLCGLPAVTLEGTKSDWEDILARVERLQSFGAEPAQWTSLLRPIINRFISAFDGERDLEFWQRICHRHHAGSGSDTYSGWITAFCVWSEEGRWRGGNGRAYAWQNLVLDGVGYPEISVENVPAGFAEVDVKLTDGEVLDCMMVAGHVGYQVVGTENNGLRPLPAWFMFVKTAEQKDAQTEGTSAPWRI